MTRFVIAGLALALGCAGSEPEQPSPTAEAGGGAEQPGWTGALDEDSFAALHELSDAEVPPLRGETVTLGSGQAYLSLPEGAGPHPGVLVIHEWWGLNDHIRHWADRLAAAGYAALAVDLYDGGVATTPDEAQALMKEVDEAEAIATLRAGHAMLAEDPRIRAPKRGLIGWCFGGGMALKGAIEIDGLDAVVMYYGRVVTDADVLRGIDAPLLGIFANRDASIPPDAVNDFDAALTGAGVEHTILRFDADHAFANPSGARYDTDNAAEAWDAVSAFFERWLR